MLLANRFELRFVAGAIVEVIFRLEALIAGVSVLLADFEGLGQPLRAVVRSADGPDFPLLGMSR